MLTESIKLNSLWKGKEGWANTHAKREVFEELYRSFKNISANSVLTYGDLIPREETDRYYQELTALTPESPFIVHAESSYKKVKIVEKVFELTLTPISANCDDTYVIIENGKQVKNIIPYDFSDTGIYNYVLKDDNDNVIPFGLCEWHLDVNSATLTFNNGIPDNVNSAKPPKITFYRYVGPVGERTYIDAALYDVSEVTFADGNPVTEFTELLKSRLDDIWGGWFETNKFKGTDTTQGIGLQYNLLTNVIDSETGDAVKGWDDNSKAQVVSLLSHKKATSENIVFVSEDTPEGEYTVQVAEAGIQKIELEDKNFVVVNAESAGDVTFSVSATENIYAVLLVRDNETQAMELYFPRGDASLTVQVPVFVDLKILPPHLKLKTLSSYSDEIIPQYYGPRQSDYVIASYETSHNLRSADYIVYNKEGAFLENAVAAMEESAHHVLLRAGTYLNDSKELVLEDVYFEGESLQFTKIEDCTLRLKGSVILQGLDLSAVKVIVDTDSVVEIKDCTVASVEGDTGSVYIRDTGVNTVEVNEGFTLLAYGAHFNRLNCNKGAISINGSSISDLHLTEASADSILNTSNITHVSEWDPKVKLDSSYVTSFDASIDPIYYPNNNTIPYYQSKGSFNERVYATLADPFEYIEEDNEIIIKIDGNTINLHEDGYLYTRFFTSEETSMVSTPKTQTEEFYDGRHEDTILIKKTVDENGNKVPLLDENGNTIPKDKPSNVDEAIIDLYWSKAGLVNGKIPLHFLPDSVAYGGLAFVGMWSFEKSGGQYPTFDNVAEDIKRDYMSDEADRIDGYTGLQKGWFFIVSGSEHIIDEDGETLDDPCYPQNAIDGTEFTAGDWVIYTGKETKKEIRKYPTSGATAESVKEILQNASFNYEYTTKDEGTVSSPFVLSEWEECDETDGMIHQFVHGMADTGDSVLFRLKKDAGDGKTICLVFMESTSKPDAGNVSAVGAIFKEGDLDIGVASMAVYNAGAEYEVEIPNCDKWERLDRGYLDPVYSRLPAKATDTEGKNVGWSIEKGGHGVIELSEKSIAEALRLINEELWAMKPGAPTSITNISVIKDEESSSIVERTFISIANGQLDDYLNRSEEVAYDITSGGLAFKQKGIHDQLPLEHEFYIGSEDKTNYEFNILDINRPKQSQILVSRSLDTGSGVQFLPMAGVDIQISDPYDKYNMGFKAPSKYKSAEVSGIFAFNDQEAYVQDYQILYELKGLEESVYMQEVSHLMGRSNSFSFKCKKFYEGDEVSIQACDPEKSNMATFNANTVKVAGITYFTGSPVLIGNFTVKHFAKYGSIYKDDYIKVTPIVNGVALDESLINVKSKMLKEVDTLEGTYDLNVEFNFPVGGALDWETDIYNIDVMVEVKSGDTIVSDTVFPVNKINYLKSLPGNVVTAEGISPALGSAGFDGTFDFTIPKYEECSILPVSKDGFEWPKESQLVDKYIEYNLPHYADVDFPESGIAKISGLSHFRSVTYKFELDGVHDLTGFDIHLEYGNDKVPEINTFTGAFYERNFGLEVIAYSEEQKIKCTHFLDANAPIPGPFFEANLGKAKETVLYPGKSDAYTRRVTFGRKPIPVEVIYVRVLLDSRSELAIKNVTIDTSTGC